MMQGVHAEVNKYFTRSVQNYIINSRVAQGQQDCNKASPEEKADIIYRWNNSKFDLKNFYFMKRKMKAAEKSPAGSEPVTPTALPFSPAGKRAGSILVICLPKTGRSFNYRRIV